MPEEVSPETEPIAVEPGLVESIRTARFSLVLRGYDRGEVDAFRARVAERLERLEAVERHPVKREFAQVGERTGAILAAAEEAAEELRNDAENDARQARAEANRKAEEIVEAAERRAQELVEDALQRVQVLEARIRRLLDRRDAALQDVERISADLSDAVAAADETPAGGEGTEAEVAETAPAAPSESA